MTEDELKRMLGRKWRVNVRYLNLLCNYYRKYFDKVLPISCNNSRLCDRIGLGCIMDLSRLLDKAVKLGLFSVVSGEYGFNHYVKENNYSRLYRIDPAMAAQIETIANVLDMGDYNKRGRRTIYIRNSIEGLEGDNFNLEISPAELPVISCRKKFPASYRKFVYDRYPQIGYVQGMLAEMNDSLEDHEHWFATSLSVNSKNLEDDMCNFSCRAYSELCGIRKVPKIPGELCRDDLLDEYFGKGCWEEFDLNASIYRIARSCRDGKWYSSVTDIYETLHGGPFASEEERGEFKTMCMITAFSMNMNSTCRGYRMAFRQFNMDHESVTKIIGPVGKAVSEFCGPVDTDVFLHESCIMTMARYRLFEKGIRAVQLYDCLFAEKGKVDDFDSIISECFDEYYRSYIK